MTYAALSLAYSSLWNQVDEEVGKDPRLSQMLIDLLQDPQSHPGFSTSRGRLYFEGKVVLPRTSAVSLLLLAEFHDSVVGGHSGFLRTLKKVAGVVY